MLPVDLLEELAVLDDLRRLAPWLDLGLIRGSVRGSTRVRLLVGRGFGEGRPPACWYLSKSGLAEIADAKGERVSDLPWVPDSS